MELKRDFIPESAACNTKRNFKEVTGITIHWIGPYPTHTPSGVRKWWIDSKAEPSAHFIVKDKEVLQCWPTNKIAWHAGNQKGNETTIGIEVVPENVEGKFSDESIATLKELVRHIKSELGNQYLGLFRHYDWSGKDCPKYYVDDNKWKQLRETIS